MSINSLKPTPFAARLNSGVRRTSRLVRTGLWLIPWLPLLCWLSEWGGRKIFCDALVFFD
jgi:hypothetical protein